MSKRKKDNFEKFWNNYTCWCMKYKKGPYKQIAEDAYNQGKGDAKKYRKM